MKSYILTIILLFIMSGVSLADDTQSNSRESSENKTERTEIRRGNKEYKSNNYVGSEIDYRKALDSNPSSLTATYNLGNSLYKQGKYSDAIKEYEKVVMSETDDKKLSEAWHNLGNSYFMEKNLPKSIEAYKNSLRINPKDDEARYNLRMAQLLLEQNQQDQQQQQEQNKEKQNTKKFCAWMEMGRQQGLFREDADFNILTFILKRDLTTIVEVKMQKGHTELSNYTPDELGRKLILFYLRGISTPKGQQIIEEYLKRNETIIE